MPRLVVRVGPNAGLEFELDPDVPRITLGRLSANHVQVLDKKASREHAEIVFKDGAFVLRDLDSRNGTLLNDVPMEEAATLSDGDRIRIGDVVLQFQDDDDVEIEEAEEV